MLKRFLTLTLALMMLVSGALASATEVMPGYYKPPVVNEGQYPIKQEGVTLKWWMPINAGAANFISSYAESPVYQAVQENTGVKIEFIHPAAGTEQESFQMMVASGDLPDLITMSSEAHYAGGFQTMYDDGVIIDLAPYLDEYAPQYKEVLNYTDTGRMQAYTDAGNVLAFYRMCHKIQNLPYQRFNCNAALLEELGLQEPRTIAEYEAFFQAVLDKKPGVIPMYYDQSANSLNLLMGAFDMLYSWYMKDSDSVGYWANADQLKDFLALMNSWYEKGYLMKDFASTSVNEVCAMFDEGQVATMTYSVDTTYTRAGSRMRLTNFPYMRKEADSVVGSKPASYPVLTSYHTVVTSACSNVEAAIQLLNYAFTYEGSLVYNYGVEDSFAYLGDDGFWEFTEYAKTTTDGMTVSNKCYIHKQHMATRYCYPDEIGIPTVAGDEEGKRVRTMWIDDAGEQEFLSLPPFVLTTEEASERADIMIQVDTYANEMMLKFITGAESLEKFDDYLAEVKARGLDRAIEITQTALERYLAK